MSEYPFSTTTDNRSPSNNWQCTYHQNGPFHPPVTLEFRSSGGNGTVHVVSGMRGGKFTPGVLKLRDFSVTDTSYSAGSFSLTGEQWWGTGKRASVPIKGSGILRGVNYASGLGGDLNRVPAKARTGWDANQAEYLRQKCFAKLTLPDDDLGAFLGELPQTMRMLTGWSRGFRNAVRLAREGGFTWQRANRAWQQLRSGGRLKELPNRLANAWLSYRYGIRPLIWDAMMFVRIANDQRKRVKEGLRRKVSRASGSEGGTSSGPRVSISNFGSYQPQTWWTSSFKCQCVVYYRSLGEASDVEWIAHKYGLHPTQVPALLWELTPLSFVVDWFVDVKTWLGSIIPPLDAKVLGWSTSYKRTVDLTTSPVGEPNYGNPASWKTKPEGNLPTDTVSVRSLTRRVFTSQSPWEFPRVRPEIALDAQKWVDLASLALQRASPTRRRP